MCFTSAFIGLCAVSCVQRQYNATESIISSATLRSGVYSNPAGAGTSLEIESSGANLTIKVLEHPEVEPILLKQTQQNEWLFNGTDACSVSVSIESAEQIKVNQKGICGNYGFLGRGPDKTNLDLSGRFTLEKFRSGIYSNLAGAGTSLEIKSFGSKSTLKVVGKSAIEPIPLTQENEHKFSFNGTDACRISVSVESPKQISIEQKGICGNYGFLGNGPDRTNLNLGGRFVLEQLQSGIYSNPAGAGRNLQIKSSGSKATLRVLRQPDIEAIALTQINGNRWLFNGTDACSISVSVESDEQIKVDQKGICGDYGFLGRGPDRTNLDLSGNYKK